MTLSRIASGCFCGTWALALALASCAQNTAYSHGRSTALDSGNLVEMTDDMTQKLLADPQVQRELSERGQLKVVIQPVENRMTGEVLPRGAKEAYVARLRTQLARCAPDKFTWVMNRDAWWALRDRELDRGPDPQRVQPQYTLTARFSSITDETSKRRSSYYLCVYYLADMETGQTIWTDRYEVKKSAMKAFLD